jgi:hypothetical protein
MNTPAAAPQRHAADGDALHEFLHDRLTIGLTPDASLAAVLVYGSWLRGKRDTLIDLYALLDDYRPLPWWQAALCRLLPPNVYHIAAGPDARAARAKCAVLSVVRFTAGTTTDFHSYFWARFVQPSQLLWCRDETAREQVVDAIAGAVRTFVRRVSPLLPANAVPRELWLRGLSATYGCELRTEKPGYAQGIVEADPQYYDALTRLTVTGNARNAAPGPATGSPGGWRTGFSWRLRRVEGKLLSAARLLKAATMFEAPLDYILWKIERHSGIHVEVTERQRRHPWLFAWPIFWRLYRQGAFR